MRYLVFAHEDYYPNGGIYDLKGAFDDLELAYECYKENRFDINTEGETYIYDTEEMKIKVIYDTYVGVRPTDFMNREENELTKVGDYNG